MQKAILVTYLAYAVIATGCSGTSLRHDHPGGGAERMRSSDEAARSVVRSTVDRDTARLRAATAAFRSLDAAVAAGYSSSGGTCLSHPT